MEYLLSFCGEDTREDIILYHALKDVKDIFWIDVGANDPIVGSVTKLFSGGGNKGINIEPQVSYLQKYKEDRPWDINLAIGISNTHGELLLYGKGAGGTFDSSNELFRDSDCTKVPVWTLKEVCDRYIKLGQEIHFLKIDVEGWEKKCIEGMDFKQYRPWILCIESTEPFSAVQTHAGWENIVIENGYVFVGMVNVNRYYVLKEKAVLIERFKQIENLEKYYDITYYLNKLKMEKYKSVFRVVKRIKSSKIMKPLKLLSVKYEARKGK